MGGIRQGVPDVEEQERDRSGDGAFFCECCRFICAWLIPIVFVGVLIVIALIPAMLQ